MFQYSGLLLLIVCVVVQVSTQAQSENTQQGPSECTKRTCDSGEVNPTEPHKDTPKAKEKVNFENMQNETDHAQQNSDNKPSKGQSGLDVSNLAAMLQLLKPQQGSSSKNKERSPPPLDIASMLNMATTFAPLLSTLLQQNNQVLKDSSKETQDKANVLLKVLPMLPHLQGLMSNPDTLKPMLEVAKGLFAGGLSKRPSMGTCPNPTWDVVFFNIID